jgi:SAM-dependent methyltransferase
MTELFNAYGAYYDLLYRNKDYASEANYVLRLLSQHGPSFSSILELGCGSGGHGQCFLEKGLGFTGVDLSPRMLELAKARGLGAFCELGDIRAYQPKAKVDAVLSLFHVMSYQTSNDDLRAVFKTASAALPPGHLFIFDYWHGPGVLTEKPAQRQVSLENETHFIKRTAVPELFPAVNRVDVRYEIQVTSKLSATTETIREVHPMRYLFPLELEDLCREHFRVVAHYGWLKDTTPSFGDWNAATVLEKI